MRKHLCNADLLFSNGDWLYNRHGIFSCLEIRVVANDRGKIASLMIMTSGWNFAMDEVSFFLSGQ
jgi:hypothetical protein